MPDFIPALSIQQPWTWLIVHRFKKIENRSRRCHYRGPVLLHAGLKEDREAMVDVATNIHPVTGDKFAFPLPAWFDNGGIVGIADIVDCIDTSDDPYFVGPFGWVIDNARPLRFQPCRGMLGFFDPKITVDLSVVT